MKFKGRALHFVFKIADRAQTAKFYRDILGMKVLRHEEFSEGCEAACNGPYQNRWSKTMVGYGPEDTHFAIELTYNYGVKSYDKGNDFVAIVIKSTEAIARAKAFDWPIKAEGEKHILEAPGGYVYHIIDQPQPKDQDPVQQVILSSTDVEKSLNYWNGLLDMNIYHQDTQSAVLGYNDTGVKLKFAFESKIDRKTAYGRIAFSIPKERLRPLEDKIKSANQTILTPLVTLDTPGKASVTVVILADPDGHEICFVDDENFRLLSAVDSNSNASLDRYIAKDKSK